MRFNDFLQNTAGEIDKELENFFQEWSKDIEHISSRLLPLTNALADGCLGGKRIRGTLVVLGYELGNFVNRPHPSPLPPRGLVSSKRRLPGEGEIMKVAAAYEIFQAAILVHDDIIDKSLLRRGKPSLYSRLGGGHAGESLAICLGDIGFFLAFQLIASTGFPEKEKNRALSIFCKTMLETGIGELLDVELARLRPSNAHATAGKQGSCGQANEAMGDVITVYKFKTAYYTITAPLLLGAVLGGLSDSSLSTIRIFGQNLGIAFQIQDDINDIFSDKKKLGKELGGDIKEGKQTLLYLYAKEHTNKQQGELLKKYYGNRAIGAEEIEAVKNVLVETGALEYIRAEAKKYSQEAKESIHEITLDERFQKMFLEMTEYFVKIKDQKSNIKA